MTEISKEVFEKYQIRKTKKQKTAFIEFIKLHYDNAVIEEGKSFVNSRNIVIGDVDNAKVIFTAHYDTCAEMYVPNFIAPKNIFVTLLYQIIFTLCMFIISGIAALVVWKLTHIDLLARCIFTGGLIIFVVLMFAGKHNKHTANDNTSGVITLLEILEELSDDERKSAAFVFFDNEELGLFGSAMFKQQHKKQMKNKLLINYDCVSDGDNIMLVVNKKASNLYADAIKSAFTDTDEKNIIITKSATTFYPSDQMNFKCYIGVAAFKRAPLIGYYIDRIHTRRDIVFDEKNIECIARGSKRLLAHLKNNN